MMCTILIFEFNSDLGFLVSEMSLKCTEKQKYILKVCDFILYMYIKDK
jgi:hypothetical protein